MPTCSGPRLTKLDNSGELKKDVLLLEPNFPQNNGLRWNKHFVNQSKGVYTWTSTPRAIYQNKKLAREQLNIQRSVFTIIKLL